jgi:hypothetical protein
MFIGHYGVGFAARSIAPKVSLGALFLAAQLLDLLCATFLLLGIERIRIVPGATAVGPLLFEHYPYSHSLAAALAWALLVGGGYLLIRRERTGGLVLGALVISHWVLDAIVHRPDLPLFPGGTTMIGLNAWFSLPIALAVEVTLFALGVWLYSRATSPVDAIGRWGYMILVVFLLAIYAASLSGRPPPNAGAVGWVGELQWLLVLWGYWIDRHRQARVQGARTGFPCPGHL